ncbi:unnamed protein product [Ilex paraguariensis]|uniref:Uncharacterized protein n=1 Tax=Ilex paraguariensis TaxID=185542 RepID=A0ABC8QS80_9AQUA
MCLLLVARAIQTPIDGIDSIAIASYSSHSLATGILAIAILAWSTGSGPIDVQRAIEMNSGSCSALYKMMKTIITLSFVPPSMLLTINTNPMEEFFNRFLILTLAVIANSQDGVGGIGSGRSGEGVKERLRLGSVRVERKVRRSR